MKIVDAICPLILLSLPAAVAWGGLEALENLALTHSGAVGFLAFGLLGPTGEALGRRLAGRGYPRASHLAASALLWAVHGLIASSVYWVINGGVFLSQGLGMLPGGGYGTGPGLLKSFLSSFLFLGPFFTSLLVCLTLTPVLLALQRLILAALDFRQERKRWPNLALASWKADWPSFIRFQLITVPLGRVPLMTLVFMLPQGFWLLAASWSWALVTGLEGWGAKKRK